MICRVHQTLLIDEANAWAAYRNWKDSGRKNKKNWLASLPMRATPVSDSENTVERARVCWQHLTV
jgi:hypothetical protein